MSLSRLSSDFWKASRAEDYAPAGLPSERGRGRATEKSTTGLCAFQGTTTSKVRCQEPTRFNQAVADGEAKPASSRTLGMGIKSKENPTGASCSAARHTVVRQLTSASHDVTRRRSPATNPRRELADQRQEVRRLQHEVCKTNGVILKQLWHGKLRCGSTDTSTENTKKQQQQKQSTTPTTKRSTNSHANKRKLVKQKNPTHRLSENGGAKNDFRTVVASLLAVARRLFIGVSFLFVSVHPRHHTTPPPPQPTQSQRLEFMPIRSRHVIRRCVISGIDPQNAA